jgi:hypothetical protein
MCVESIARAEHEGRLQYAFKYEELRERFPEFDREVREKMERFVRSGGWGG